MTVGQLGRQKDAEGCTSVIPTCDCGTAGQTEGCTRVISTCNCRTAGQTKEWIGKIRYTLLSHKELFFLPVIARQLGRQEDVGMDEDVDDGARLAVTLS